MNKPRPRMSIFSAVVSLAAMGLSAVAPPAIPLPQLPARRPGSLYARGHSGSKKPIDVAKRRMRNAMAHASRKDQQRKAKAAR